jgi:hypothetical protein
MPPRDERELAARLALVLDGEPAAEPEVASLAAVLERATEPARFAVPDAEVERALAGARPRLLRGRERPNRPRRIVVAVAGVAVVAAGVLAVTLSNLPGVDIEGKALAALDGGGILRVDERIVPARRGTFPPSERMTWIDQRGGRLYSIHFVGGNTAEITLVEPGRIYRYEPQRNLVVTGRDCRALEGGCPIDPVAFYRRALLAPGGVRYEKTHVRGRPAYRLTLPIQKLPGAVSVEQRALVDAKTFRPLRIVWLERRGTAPLRPVSIIRFTSVVHIPRDSTELQGIFVLRLPQGTHIVQRRAPGRSLRLVGTRALSLSEARRVQAPLHWLGRSFDGRRLQGIERIRWNAGIAYRLRYRGLTVWNYRSVIPPDLVAGRIGAEPKVVPFLHGVARFYGSRSGRLVLELDTRGRSVAVVAPDLYKEQLLRVLKALKPLQ